MRSKNRYWVLKYIIYTYRLKKPWSGAQKIFTFVIVFMSFSFFPHAVRYHKTIWRKYIFLNKTINYFCSLWIFFQLYWPSRPLIIKMRYYFKLHANYIKSHPTPFPWNPCNNKNPNYRYYYYYFLKTKITVWLTQ